MAQLKKIEKRYFEDLFNMSSGYVLDFSNRTFEEFFLDTVNIDIYEEKYNYWSGSKANRLRSFLDQEDDKTVGKILDELLEHYFYLVNSTEYYNEIYNENLYKKCKEITERLKNSEFIDSKDAFNKNTGDDNFDRLAKIIRSHIDNNEPETGLDRLHTYMVKYVRKLCEKHKIPIEKTKTIHSLFGEYVKRIKEKNLIKAEMTVRILKTTISLLDSFNDIRNNRSYAHDNPLLDYNESLLIFNNVASTIKFIDALENDIRIDEEESVDLEIPF